MAVDDFYVCADIEGDYLYVSINSDRKNVIYSCSVFRNGKKLLRLNFGDKKEFKFKLYKIPGHYEVFGLFKLDDEMYKARTTIQYIPEYRYGCDVIDFSDGKFNFKLNDWNIPCYFKKGKGKKLFVLFTAAIDRRTACIPVFNRWSWSECFPGSILCISDPTLDLDSSLGLAWYLGTRSSDAMESVAEVVRLVMEQLVLREDDVVGYGSSGGGTAAIRLLSFLPKARAVAINPQIYLTKFNENAVNKVLTHCFGGLDREEALLRYPKRLSVAQAVKDMVDPKILYVQNIMDKRHYKDHFVPFCSDVGLPVSGGRKKRMKSYIYSDPRGHVAESKNMVSDILKFVMSL